MANSKFEIALNKVHTANYEPEEGYDTIYMSVKIK